MQLIRIEDPINNLGVWRSNDFTGTCKLRNHSNFEEINKRHCTSAFPTPREDSELQKKLNGRYVEAYNFAFLSLEQLEQGFTREELREIIIDLGFRVYNIEATEVIHSNYQAMFKYESIVSKEDISFMFL